VTDSSSSTQIGPLSEIDFDNDGIPDAYVSDVNGHDVYVSLRFIKRLVGWGIATAAAGVSAWFGLLI
jgi:hypothetical protein